MSKEVVELNQTEELTSEVDSVDAEIVEGECVEPDAPAPEPTYINKLIAEHRFGKFRIDYSMLYNTSMELMRKLYSNVIITRAEMLMAENCIEYVAVSPFFAPVPEGAEVTTYCIDTVVEEVIIPAAEHGQPSSKGVVLVDFELRKGAIGNGNRTILR